MRDNWIAVASAEHARRGCATPAQGYMQVGHGKCAPLKRVMPGDRMAYYAPTITMGGKDKCQSLVSIGLVRAGETYAFDMGGGFVPFRRDVAYVPARQASFCHCSTCSSLLKTVPAGATSFALACSKSAMATCG